MLIYFNALGVITGTNVADEAIRQGNVGNTIKAYFSGKNNNNYTAKLNFTRPDGTHLDNLVMTPSPTNSTLFTFVLNDEWYLAIDGSASLTIFLYDGNGNIVANGQHTFSIQDTDYNDDPDTISTEQYNSLLALVSQKNNVANSIVIVDDIDEVTLSNYSDGQYFYCKTNETYYQYDADESTYVKVENGNGILASKRTMVRFYGDFATNTLQSLFDKMGHRVFIMSQNGTIDYLIHFQIYNSQVYATRAVRLYDLRSWYATIEQLPLSNYLSALINNTYDDRMLHLSNAKDYVVPYSGATDDVELGYHYIRAQTFALLNGFSIWDDSGNASLGTDGGYINIVSGANYLGSEIANQNYVASYANDNLVNLTGSQTITGQKTFSNRIIVSGYFNLYNAQITTNSKSSFARVGVTTNQYVNYELPYNYNDAGNTTFTLATTSMFARSNLVSILGEASQSLNGLLSAEDKRRLDVLYALLGEEGDADDVIDTINEVLAIFENYPEGFDIAGALALKVAIADIVDNLTSDSAVVPLSAKQGKVLKTHIDNIVSGATTVKKAEQDKNGNDIVDTYMNRTDAFSVAMVEVSDYNENTGEVTLTYNSNGVSSIVYDDNTGVVTFTY